MTYSKQERFIKQDIEEQTKHKKAHVIWAFLNVQC